MKRLQRIVLIAGITFPIVSEAQGPSPNGDLMRGVIDPLDVGRQRAAFLRAAGVDSELTQEEFEADAAGPKGFAQPFDKWDALDRYDRNSNGSIDWLEAEAYRSDLRAAFLAEYDADQDGRLAESEREKANEALAAGRLPRVQTSRPGDTPPASQDPQFQEIQRRLIEKHDSDGDGELNREERRAAREEGRRLLGDSLIQRYDADGDGELSQSEREQIARQFRERRERFLKRRFDRNDDGLLSDEERAEMERAREEFERGREEARRQFMQEFDSDRDGQLSREERQAVRETFRQRGEERRREMLERFDANGDGELSREERAKAREEFGGPGRFGIPDGFRDRGGPQQRDR